MEYVNHKSDLVDVLTTPGLVVKDRPILNPDISEECLRAAYTQMAKVLLQLNMHSFEKIGCISKVADDDDFDDRWEVKHRPLTLNMNELVQLGGVSPSHLPTGPFTTSSSYYLTLAEMHMIHLSSQRSAEDCKRKYIARCLFHKLARDGRFCTNHSNANGQRPFKLFCDNFRPAIVLVDGDVRLSGVVDWEFTYAAPPEFSRSSPFWLIIEHPEYWNQALDDWTREYETRLPIFLDVLREQEEDGLRRGVLLEPQNLSQHMRQSWETKRLFGDGDLEERFQLLTEEERAGMKDFIERKIKEEEEHALPVWPPV
ncbi:hypothetical protein AJ79_04322 [Helicocarpus griseus UAMH5409]|uniref:Aminoglycoside phosphotransferase domain-containing protein n=1 Tax=Helicocarpus griseus UAMH5409 TaxID=1447875 RepID=A0A2B7XKV7_9EURO|nr:hypothetical protein AJ79_04322 [Helicocarpus griseus UAMH5409]